MSVPAPVENSGVHPAAAAVRSSDTVWALLTMIAFSMVGNTVLVVQPMVVGGLVDLLHFSERQAGFIAAAELLGFSLASLVVLTFVHKVNRRVLALVGVAIVVVVDIIACTIKTFPPMLVLRFMAGAGSATAYAIFPTLAAASSRPERVFGIVNATSIAYAGVFVWLAPKLLQLWHLPGIFLTMAALAVIVSPTIKWAPAYSGARAVQGAERVGGARPRMKFNTNIAMLLGVLFFLYVGHGGIWAYQERIGVAAGLAKEQIGNLLGSSMLIWGVAGSLLATWLGLAIGRIWPQIISLGASILAALLLVLGASALTYGVACALIAFSWFYGLPYQTGLLALFDPKGRANIGGVLTSTMGSALGPSLAAILLGYGGHAAIGAMAGVCYVICLILVLISIKQLARTHPEALRSRSY
jgi:predicted MFS family arabinose efflux permease